MQCVSGDVNGLLLLASLHSRRRHISVGNYSLKCGFVFARNTGVSLPILVAGEWRGGYFSDGRRLPDYTALAYLRPMRDGGNAFIITPDDALAPLSARATARTEARRRSPLISLLHSGLTTFERGRYSSDVALRSMAIVYRR